MSSSYRFGNYILHPTRDWPWLGTLEWNQSFAGSAYTSTAAKKSICDVCGKLKGPNEAKLKKIPKFDGWTVVKTAESPVSATASPIPNGTDASVASGDSQSDALLTSFYSFADSSSCDFCSCWKVAKTPEFLPDSVASDLAAAYDPSLSVLFNTVAGPSVNATHKQLLPQSPAEENLTASEKAAPSVPKTESTGNLETNYQPTSTPEFLAKLSAASDPNLFGTQNNNNSAHAVVSFYDIGFAEGLLLAHQSNLSNGAPMNNLQMAYGEIADLYPTFGSQGAQVVYDKMSMMGSTKRNLKQWRVQWYPTGDTGELDGTEVDLIKSPEAASFHVGGFIRRKVPLKNHSGSVAFSPHDEYNSIIPVETPAQEIGGVIKSVHYTADVFVLPGYQWVLKEVPGDLLRPPKCFGDTKSFALYRNRWLGLICGNSYTLTLKLHRESGRCVLANEAVQMLRNCNGRHKEPGFLGALFEGQLVEGPISCLRNAIWLEEPSSDLKAKIGELMQEDSGASGDDGSRKCLHRQWSYARKWKGGFNTGPSTRKHTSKANEETVELVVEKIELAKISIDWQMQLPPGEKRWRLVKNSPSNEGGSSDKPPDILMNEDLSGLELLHIPVVNRFHEFRCKYMYTVKESDVFLSREEWRRQFLSPNGLGTSDLSKSADSTPPSPGSEICVEVLVKRDACDVIWETGDVDQNMTSADMHSQMIVSDVSMYIDTRFYPGMYVELVSAIAAKSVGGGKSADGKYSNLTGSSKSPAMGKAVAKKQSGHDDSSRKEFGVVRRSSTKEKYAVVEWFRVESAPNGQGHSAVEPHLVSLKVEEVSFYDLKPIRSFRPGELVTRVHPTMLTAQLGYVKSTDVKGCATVAWHRPISSSLPSNAGVTESCFDFAEDRLFPFGLTRMIFCQNGIFSGLMPSLAEAGGLISVGAVDPDSADVDYGHETESAGDLDDYPGSTYADSDGEEVVMMGGYGHPGEHYGPYSDEEHDGGEDGLKYFNYETLSVEERKKRIIFAIRLLRPIVNNLRLLFTSVHNLLPFMQRRRLVRIVTNIVDIVNGFIFSSEFRDALKEFWTKNGFKAVSKKQVVKPSLKKFCEKVIDDATYLATCDLLKSSVGSTHPLAAEISEVTNQLTTISDQTKMKIFETLTPTLEESISAANQLEDKSDEVGGGSGAVAAGWFHAVPNFPYIPGQNDSADHEYVSYDDLTADASVMSDDSETHMPGAVAPPPVSAEANGPIATLTYAGLTPDEIQFIDSHPPPYPVRRAVSDVFLQSPADRLYDWVTIMDSLDHAIKINAKSSKRQQKKEAVEEGKSKAKSVELVKEKAEPTEEAFAGQLKMYQGCFDLIKQIKCGLVAISLGIRSGSTSSPSFVNGIGGQLTSKYKMAVGGTDGDKTGFVELTLVRDFLRLLEPKPNANNFLKVIPCFSFQKRTDTELSALEKRWKTVKWKPVGTKQPASVPTIESTVLSEMANASGQWDSPSDIVRKAQELLEEVASGDKIQFDFERDNILNESNLLCEAISLSLLSLVNSLLDLAAGVLGYDESADTSGPSTSDADQSESEAELNGLKVSDVVEADMTVEEHPAFSPGVRGVFEVVGEVPPSHHYYTKPYDPTMVPKTFIKAVRKEIRLLQTSLPVGITVKAFENRMDLFSCMITGPLGTPYADGIFLFDVHLREDYPLRPPQVFYSSFSRRINPNLYEEGLVCLSLLGTWDGNETELWTNSSNLLQVFISIQSLILVAEPYFNEPGYERSRGTTEGQIKSREYNEMTVLRSLECLTKIVNDPPGLFKSEIKTHLQEAAPRLKLQLQQYEVGMEDIGFPLFPVTQGFRLCIRRYADSLKTASERDGIAF